MSIHKEVFGQGQSIVLIHGWAMHTEVWRGFAQQLSPSYQVTCLDLPGHGLSDTVDPYTLEQISMALVDQLPENPCCVLGWSLGASVAITMAKYYPQKIKSLILLAGNPRFVQDETWAGMNQSLLEHFSAQLSVNPQKTLLRFLSMQVNCFQNGKQTLKDLKQALQLHDVPHEKVLQAGLNILIEADLREDLAQLSCPISVIQGSLDGLVPEQVAYDMKKIQPQCDVNIILDAGHVPFLSNQSEVIDMINYFLDK
jgi:pimeloyl-[acyl-carrier protein] methyl ester esterase